MKWKGVFAIRALLDRRLEILVGVDDAILEGISAGATGWIAGLANALPRESVDLFNYGVAGETEKAFELYRWFLPCCEWIRPPLRSADQVSAGRTGSRQSKSSPTASRIGRRRTPRGKKGHRYCGSHTRAGSSRLRKVQITKAKSR
jgi:hypothetical protein